MKFEMQFENTKEFQKIKSITFNYHYKVVMKRPRAIWGLQNSNVQIFYGDKVIDPSAFMAMSGEWFITDVETSDNKWICIQHINVTHDKITFAVHEKCYSLYSMWTIDTPDIKLSVTYPQYQAICKWVRHEDHKRNFQNALANMDIPLYVEKYIMEDERFAKAAEQFDYLCTEKLTGEDEADCIAQIMRTYGQPCTYQVLCQHIHDQEWVHNIVLFPQQAQKLKEQVQELTSENSCLSSDQVDRNQTVMVDSDRLPFAIKMIKNISCIGKYEFK